MYCNQCGSEINSETKFCPNCGNKVSKTTKKNEAGVRKEIKNESRYQSKKIPILGLIIMLILEIILTFIIYQITGYYWYNEYIPYNLFIISMLVLSIPIFFTVLGIVNVTGKLNQNKQAKITDLFPFKKIKKIIYVIITQIIFAAVIFALECILGHIEDDNVTLIMILLMAVIVVYLYPIIDIFIHYVLDDSNKDKSYIISLKETIKLLKKHHTEYYAMYVSFAGWIILGAFTLGILYLWLYPYMISAINNMYLNWAGKKEITSSEHGLSNSAILGIYTGIIVVLFIALEFLSSFYTEYIKRQYPVESANTVTIESDEDKISFSIPSTFYKTNESENQTQIENMYGDYIIYTLKFKYQDYYQKEKSESEEYYKSISQNVKSKEYTAEISNNKLKAFYIDYEYEGDIYRNTTLFIPLKDNYYVSVDLGIEELDKTNIKDYVIINNFYENM